MGDPYEVVGVPRDASPEAIKKAYRERARALHPDRNKAADAEARFKELQAAYAVLSDPTRKSRHDGVSQGRGVPRTFLEDFTDSVERAEVLIFEALLPRYLDRGPAQASAAFAADLLANRLAQTATEGAPGWLASLRAHRAMRRIQVHIDYGHAWGRVHTYRVAGPGKVRWSVDIYPLAFWQEGVRDTIHLDDAVLVTLASQVISVLAAEAGFSRALSGGDPARIAERARAHDRRVSLQRWRSRALWLLVALASASLLYAGFADL